MSRKHHAAEKSGRYGRPEDAYENVRLDDAQGGMGANLRAEYIGAAPDVLIELALDALREREKLVDDLLQHLPRNLEPQIKAIGEPLHNARQALAAAAYLIDNARAALAPNPPPER